MRALAAIATAACPQMTQSGHLSATQPPDGATIYGLPTGFPHLMQVHLIIVMRKDATGTQIRQIRNR